MTDLAPVAGPVAWSSVRDRLRERGLRWTPQRRTLIEVLSQADGHVTGSELVDRCRDLDPTTIPSTVYRTLDVLEELGLVSHSHAADGREEFHVLPRDDHGHLHCIGCGQTWEIGTDEAASLVAAVAAARRIQGRPVAPLDRRPLRRVPGTRRGGMTEVRPTPDQRPVAGGRRSSHAAVMPIDFVGFTQDRRITGAMPLADDRLSDMLNSVARIVIRDATVANLVDGGQPLGGDVMLPVGDLIVVVGSGRRGSESQRVRTAVRQVSIGLGRYVVAGCLHVPVDALDVPLSSDPARVLAGRDILVPLTNATVTYDCAAVATTEQHDTVLVNRARATWIDVAEPAGLDEDFDDAAEIAAHRTNYVKDFTGTVAD